VQLLGLPPWALPFLISSGLLLACSVVVTAKLEETTVESTAQQSARDPEIAPGAAPSYGAVDQEPATGEGGVDLWTLGVLLVMAAAHSAVFLGWEVTYPVFASIPSSSAGQGWSTAEIGFTFAAASSVLIPFSILLYPGLVRSWGLLTTWTRCWLPALVLIPSFPRGVSLLLAAGWAEHSGAVVAWNYLSQMLFSLLLGTGFMSCQLMLFDFVAGQPKADSLTALATGYLVTAQGLARGAAPVLCGALTSTGLSSESSTTGWFSRSLAFDVLAIIGLFLCAAPVWLLPAGFVPDCRTRSTETRTVKAASSSAQGLLTQ